MKQSTIHTTVPAGRHPSLRLTAEHLAMDSMELLAEAELMGLHFNTPRNAQTLSAAMDAVTDPWTTASIGTPIQFLQEWLPGTVFIATAARNIDDLIGYSVVGRWEDEQIVQKYEDLVGNAVPYGDRSNMPESSWNVNVEVRTIVRFEEGFQVDRLEEARAAAYQVNSAADKRTACTLALEIIRNSVGFFGYNDGANATYGFLNEPTLPAYVTVATGASSSTLWSTKTFGEIVADIITAAALLQAQSKNLINPATSSMTLAMASSVQQFLNTPNDLGVSAADWLKANYPNIRVTSAPELDAANSLANVFYLYADRIDDQSTDDGAVWLQAVPSKFYSLGVGQDTKFSREDYSNASAGVMLKRPWACVRYTGI